MTKLPFDICTMIKVVIFDDNKARRDSLKLLLESYDEFEVSGIFPDALELQKVISEMLPDVILMDIQMPGISGIDAVKIINDLFPNIKVIMQTVFDDDEKIFDALRFGASGYILKKADPSKIVEAIHEVLAGGSPMTPVIATRVLQFFRKDNSPSKEDFFISDREKEILNLLIEGNSYKMIADKLNISYHTVNSHIKKIYDKLQVHSVGEAVSKAIQHKIIE